MLPVSATEKAENERLVAGHLQPQAAVDHDLVLPDKGPTTFFVDLEDTVTSVLKIRSNEACRVLPEEAIVVVPQSIEPRRLLAMLPVKNMSRLCTGV